MTFNSVHLIKKTPGITSTQLCIVSFFKVKEIEKKGKHPERGDWDINGGGGGGAEGD